MRIRSAFLLKHCEMLLLLLLCVCVYTLVEMPASLSLLTCDYLEGLFESGGTYIVKRVEGLMAAELMALSVGRSGEDEEERGGFCVCALELMELFSFIL